MTRMWSGWSKFRDFVSLIASRGLPYEQKVDYILHVYVALLLWKWDLYGSQLTYFSPVSHFYTHWGYILSVDRISAEELRTRAKLKSIRECLQDRWLHWFGHLKRLERVLGAVNVEPSRLVVVFQEGNIEKLWNEVVRSDQKECQQGPS